VNRYILEPVYMIGVTVVILALWFAVDLLLRWLWSKAATTNNGRTSGDSASPPAALVGRRR
jgi:hypothetical protein